MPVVPSSLNISDADMPRFPEVKNQCMGFRKNVCILYTIGCLNCLKITFVLVLLICNLIKLR